MEPVPVKAGHDVLDLLRQCGAESVSARSIGWGGVGLGLASVLGAEVLPQGAADDLGLAALPVLGPPGGGSCLVGREVAHFPDEATRRVSGGACTSDQTDCAVSRRLLGRATIRAARDHVERR